MRSTKLLQVGDSQLAFLSLCSVIAFCILKGFHFSHPQSDLGQEELGKRGCSTKDLSTLDVDLKARHVTTEELSHAIGRQLEGNWMNKQLAASRPAPWWDRACDLGLLIGTFTYGLHSYRAMQNDNDLPFQKKVCGATKDDYSCSQAYQTFSCATKAARNTFDKALSVSQAKHAADEGIVLNPLANERVDQPSVQEPSKLPPTYDSMGDVIKSEENLQSKAHIDDGVVTISCLSRNIHQAVDERIRTIREESANESAKNNTTPHEIRPMPDSRCLDTRVLKLIDLIESTDPKKSLACRTEMTIQNSAGLKKQAVKKRLCHYLGIPERGEELLRVPFGCNASTVNRNILDGTSSYLLGAASENLAVISTPHESLKYKRGPGVPSVLTRYGMIALLYTDTSMFKKFLDIEEEMLKEKERDVQIVDSAVIRNDDAHVDSTKMAHGKLRSSYMKCVPPTLMNDAVQRTGLCGALLCCGYSLPTETTSPTVPIGTLKELCHFDSFSFFSITNLLEVASQIIGSNVSFSEEGAILYIKKVLIPHCTRACLMSSDSSSDETRVPPLIKTSIDNVQENTYLPDPFLPLSQQSGEAIRNASALLRRMKMATTIQFLLGEGGAIKLPDLLDFLKSPKMRNYTDGVPLWWCPWIHDLALLAHGARFGLLSIVRHRQDNLVVESSGGEKSTDEGFLDILEIEKHIKRLFFDDDNMDNLSHNFPERRLLPKLLIEKASPMELQRLVDGLVKQFPSS